MATVTKKAPIAAGAAIGANAKSTGIVAYCVKTREKNVPMLNAVIDIKGGRYVAIGVDDVGNKMAAMLSKATAEGHVAAKRAKKGIGW